MIFKYLTKTAPIEIEWRDDGEGESKGFDPTGLYVARVSYLIFKDADSKLWNAAVALKDGYRLLADIGIYKDAATAKAACEAKINGSR